MRYVDLSGAVGNKRKRRGFSRGGFFVGALVLFLGFVLLGRGDFFSTLLTPVTVFSQAFLPRELKQTDDRVNLLLVGLDQRENAAYRGGILTDTLLLVSYRLSDGEVVLLSVPRDLWVSLPALAGGGSKINAVYAFGEEQESEGGGASRLASTLSQVLDLPIHYVGVVNFAAFRKAVDLVGGITVEVENSFDDLTYPREGFEDAPLSQRYRRVSFKKGIQAMDGETALRFVRSRHAAGIEGTDFARAKRQQKVLLSLRDKILSSETFLDWGKLFSLYETLKEGFHTNANLWELRAAYEIAASRKEAQIISFVLDDNPENPFGLLINPKDSSPYGYQWVLIPQSGDFAKIQAFLKERL